MANSDSRSSALAAGHIVIPVQDMRASLDFYARIGLPTFLELDGLALIELRGGTHVILAEGVEGMEASRYGQMPAETGERLDLMLDTDAKSDLEAFRQDLIGKGIEASAVNESAYFGHWFFHVRDPDGNVIFIYTSHEIRFM